MPDPGPAFRQLLAFDRWANAETVASLEQAGAPPAGAVRLLAHLVGASRLWLGRIRGAATPAEVWPGLTLAECAGGLEETAAAWEALLERAAPGELAREVHYVNSKGEPWASRVGDILTHIVTHGVYHRGQIAGLLRAAGHEPAYTDFIQGVRAGGLPDWTRRA